MPWDGTQPLQTERPRHAEPGAFESIVQVSRHTTSRHAHTTGPNRRLCGAARHPRAHSDALVSDWRTQVRPESRCRRASIPRIVLCPIVPIERAGWHTSGVRLPRLSLATVGVFTLTGVVLLGCTGPNDGDNAVSSNSNRASADTPEIVSDLSATENGVTYFALVSDVLAAVVHDPSTGRIVWTSPATRGYEPLGTVMAAPAVVAGGEVVVYLGVNQGDGPPFAVRAVDAATGSLIWHHDIEGAIGQPFECGPAVCLTVSVDSGAWTLRWNPLTGTELEIGRHGLIRTVASDSSGRSLTIDPQTGAVEATAAFGQTSLFTTTVSELFGSADATPDKGWVGHSTPDGGWVVSLGAGPYKWKTVGIAPDGTPRWTSDLRPCLKPNAVEFVGLCEGTPYNEASNTVSAITLGDPTTGKPRTRIGMTPFDSRLDESESLSVDGDRLLLRSGGANVHIVDMPTGSVEGTKRAVGWCTERTRFFAHATRPVMVDPPKSDVAVSGRYPCRLGGADLTDKETRNAFNAGDLVSSLGQGGPLVTARHLVWIRNRSIRSIAIDR